MKKFILLLLAMTGMAVFAEDAAKDMNLANFRIYKDKNRAGIVETIPKTAETPLRKRFVADTSADSYIIQIYGHDPVALDDVKTYTLTYTVSADASADGDIGFALKTKNKKYGWYGSLRAGVGKAETLTPGTHTIVATVDLKTYKLPELGYLCPTVTVKGLKKGTVTIESIKVTTSK